MIYSLSSIKTIRPNIRPSTLLDIRPKVRITTKICSSFHNVGFINSRYIRHRKPTPQCSLDVGAPLSPQTRGGSGGGRG